MCGICQVLLQFTSFTQSSVGVDNAPMLWPVQSAEFFQIRVTILIFSIAKNFRRSRGEAKLGFVQKTVHAQGVGKIPQDRVPLTCLKGAVCSYGPLSLEVNYLK